MRDDIQVIPVGNGKPNTICVTKGVNNFRDTTPRGDDQIVGDDIHTGADGICNTPANDTNLVPANVPSAAAAQNYLNDITWGRQANVQFAVSRSDTTVNYDVNRNGQCADSPLTEINLIDAAAKDPVADFNIYYVSAMEVPVASTLISRRMTWIGDSHTRSTLNVTAHEVGHLLRISGDSSETDELMYGADSYTDPCRVVKRDWDVVNP